MVRIEIVCWRKKGRKMNLISLSLSLANGDEDYFFNRVHQPENILLLVGADNVELTVQNGGIHVQSGRLERSRHFRGFMIIISPRFLCWIIFFIYLKWAARD